MAAPRRPTPTPSSPGPAARNPRTLCDAVTVNPYLGSDSDHALRGRLPRSRRRPLRPRSHLEPLEREFQTLPIEGSDDAVVDRVADAVVGWGSDLIGERGMSSIGAVVGATHPDELHRLRRRMPHVPFLLPGYGAQGAGAADVVGGFENHLQGAS